VKNVIVGGGKEEVPWRHWNKNAIDKKYISKRKRESRLLRVISIGFRALNVIQTLDVTDLVNTSPD